MEEGKHFKTITDKAPKLERELHKAAELITWLRESVKGKLLLEALMATYNVSNKEFFLLIS